MPIINTYNIMEELPIEQLIECCIQYIQGNCYSENRISKYKSLWKYGILRFMTMQQQTLYTKSVGEAFVQTCHFDGVVRHQEREKIRSIQVLDDMLSTGKIRKRCFSPVQHPLYGEIGQQMELLIMHLFRFWHEEHISPTDFASTLDFYKWVKKEKIPSFYTASEIQRIESSVVRSSGVSKRNYAMLLLATRLGLRASDIAGLRFSDLDWDKNLIKLKMQKTGKNIELPLLANVGNSIIDYLQYGRAQSLLQNIFLSSRAPYMAATKDSVCAAIREIIDKSGINTEGKHHGPHSMRHSLASALLQNGTTSPVISETLGHQNTQTTMTYLKIDFSSLIQCALPVSPVPESFYEQKGGLFYE
jgi:site-specific recombinase XerD